MKINIHNYKQTCLNRKIKDIHFNYYCGDLSVTRHDCEKDRGVIKPSLSLTVTEYILMHCVSWDSTYIFSSLYRQTRIALIRPNTEHVSWNNFTLADYTP
jgi:hypothetical protein